MLKQTDEVAYQNEEWLRERYIDDGLSSREIARRCNVSKSTVLNWLKRHKIDPRSLSNAHRYRDTYRKKEFSSEPSEDLAYIVGVLLGDGWIKKNQGNYKTGLISSDKAFNESFYKSLEAIDLNPSMYKNGKGYWETIAYSKSFFEWWSKMSTEKIWNFVSGRKELKRELIKGFYESEGTLAEYRVRMYNSDKEILYLIQKALTNLQFETSITQKETHTLSILGGKEERRRFLEEIKPIVKGG